MERYIAVGKNTIHVTVSGSGAPIVFLPGMGDPSPMLGMRPLAEKLQDQFTCVIYEPPGYGLSDPAKTPRTIENITGEISAVMHALGFARYAIAAHSISGLYAMYLLAHAREEITGFVAMDISIANQFEHKSYTDETEMITAKRQKGLDNYDEAFAAELTKGYMGLLKMLSQRPFTEEELTLYRDILLRNAHDPSVIDEIQRTIANAAAIAGVTIPDDCPALMLIANDNIQRLPEWEPWHRSVCGAATQVHIMECNHMVHLMKTEETAALIRELLQNV